VVARFLVLRIDAQRLLAPAEARRDRSARVLPPLQREARLHLVDARAVGVGEAAAGIRPEALVELLDGPPDGALGIEAVQDLVAGAFPEDDPEVVAREGKLGVQAQRLAVGLLRLVERRPRVPALGLRVLRLREEVVPQVVER